MRQAMAVGMLACLIGVTSAHAQPPADAANTRRPASYDAALAKSTGGDDYGMRQYVFVLLRTGPTPVPKGPARDEMFAGHMANINRLAEAGSLVYAGPMDGVDGWRGIFILAVDSVDAARELVATDPVIRSGEMVAEYHTHYGSAALMLVNGLHARIAKKPI